MFSCNRSDVDTDYIFESEYVLRWRFCSSKLNPFFSLVLIISVQQSSSPPVSTQCRDDEASHAENGIGPSKIEPTHSQKTVPALEQQIKDYEKRVRDLEHEVTILQLKVRELEANDTSHLACKVEAHSLRRDKEAAEALVAAYKELVLANELIISRTPSQGCSKKRRGVPEGDESSIGKRQKP